MTQPAGQLKKHGATVEEARVDEAPSCRIESEGEVLTYGPLEEAKLNIGHFAGLKNVGSQFPIGEVFTEARDLEGVSGRARIYGFADANFRLNCPAEPITLVISGGRVAQAIDSTSDFDRVLELIAEGEGLRAGRGGAFCGCHAVPSLRHLIMRSGV